MTTIDSSPSAPKGETGSTDNLERLRLFADEPAACAKAETFPAKLRAAADELQRLRAERDELKLMVQTSPHTWTAYDVKKYGEQSARIAALEAEIAKVTRDYHETAQRCDPAGETAERLKALDVGRAAIEQLEKAESALEARDRLIADLKHDYDQACKHLADALAARNEFMEERNAARKELSEVFGGPALTRAFRLERNSARFERDAALEVIAELVSGHLVNGEYCRHCGHGIMADDTHAEGCVVARAAAMKRGGTDAR